MNTENVACEIVDKIIKHFYGYIGFFAWFFERTESSTRRDIENNLVGIVKNILDKNA